MTRDRGLLAFEANFELNVAAPIDARSIVSKKEYLYQDETWQTGSEKKHYAYPGMTTSVFADTNENNGTYLLLALPYTNPNNWMKQSGSLNTGTVDLATNEEYLDGIIQTKAPNVKQVRDSFDLLNVKIENLERTVDDLELPGIGSLDNYYDKSEIDNKVSYIDGRIDLLSSAYTYRGTVDTPADLPTVDLSVGDVYNTLDPGTNYAWTGTEWDSLSGVVDLSGYPTNEKLNLELIKKQDVLTAGSNITITDGVISATPEGSDPSGYVSNDDLDAALLTVQSKLIAGDNITITGTTISASVPDTDGYVSEEDLNMAMANKQNLLTPGDSITIENGVISAIVEETDLSGYSTTLQMNAELDKKQDQLTTGDNVEIVNNVISVTIPDSGAQIATDEEFTTGTATDKATSVKQVADGIKAINDKLANVYKFKGSVDNYAALPTENIEVGHVYNLLDTGANYAWDGTDWDSLGLVINMDEYVKTTELEAALEDPTNLPAASLDDRGIVQLSNATDSTNETMAATPKALKILGDRIAISASISNPGIVQLSNALDSESEGLAATAKAIKLTNDKILGLDTKFSGLLIDGTLEDKGIVQLTSTPSTDNETMAMTPKGVSNAIKIAVPDGTVTQKGILQLSSDIDNTSEILAATPKAINEVRLLTVTAQERADEAFNKPFPSIPEASLTEKGIVQLSTELSESEEIAMTVKAGKILADRIETGDMRSATLTQTGVTQLSNEIDSDSEILAATPKAVASVKELVDTNIANIAVVKGEAATAQSRADEAYTRTQDATTTNKGIVQLTSTFTEEDNETMAVTPLGVKNYLTNNWELLVPDASITSKGIVQLTDVVIDSETLVPTSKAVVGAIADIPDATHTERGLVVLASSGESSTNAMTPLGSMNVHRQHRYIKAPAKPTSLDILVDTGWQYHITYRLYNVNDSNVTHTGYPPTIKDIVLKVEGYVQSDFGSGDAVSETPVASFIRQVATDADNRIFVRVASGDMADPTWSDWDTYYYHSDIVIASLTDRGIVQLTNSVDDTNEELAVTPKGVSEFLRNNWSVIIGQATSEQLGAVTLDSELSTSPVLVPTSLIVKTYVDQINTALDAKITTAQEKADAAYDKELPVASTSAQGIVQLSSDRYSESEEVAMTPKGVKSHIDNLVTTFPIASTTERGIVALSNTIDNSETHAVTPKAVSEAINGAVSKLGIVYRYVGSVDNYESLPTEDVEEGHVYNLRDTGKNYAWTGTEWDDLGGVTDLSGYAKKEDLDTKVGVDEMVNHVNDVLSPTTSNLLPLMSMKPISLPQVTQDAIFNPANTVSTGIGAMGETVSFDCRKTYLETDDESSLFDTMVVKGLSAGTSVTFYAFSTKEEYELDMFDTLHNESSADITYTVPEEFKNAYCVRIGLTNTTTAFSGTHIGIYREDTRVLSGTVTFSVEEIPDSGGKKRGILTLH